MQIQLPEKVQYIIQALEEAGFEAYAVGGCVRILCLAEYLMTGISRPLPDRWR